MFIRLLKEKFYDKLQKQVKQLKEDKLLLNLVNASLCNSTGTQYLTATALAAVASPPSLSLNDRRSLRKRELHSRFIAGETDDLSDNNSNSAASRSNANGYISASGKRRRHYATRYLSNDELSSGITSAGTSHNNGDKLHHLGIGSGNDSNLSDKDYDSLNLLIANEDGGVSEIFASKGKISTRPNTRQKQFTGVQGLRLEELNEDLALFRNSVNGRKS